MPLSAGVHFLGPTIPVHVLEASSAGPTAIIQAGIHGDEVAGVHAICELLESEFRPTAGRLLLIPVMNPPAYRARQRAAPGGLDLNRCFPGSSDAHAREHRLAHKFLSLCIDEKPALVATLHESHKRYDPDVYPSFGQTIVYGVEPMPAIVQRTVDALNGSLQDPNEQWAPQHFPVATSSTEIIVDKVGCIGLCIETWMGFSEERRVEMQTAVVKTLLRDLGMC